MPFDRGGEWPEWPEGGGWFLVFYKVFPEKNLYTLASDLSLSTLCLSFPASLACILCLSHLPLLPASLALPSIPLSFAASLACLAWTGPLRGPSRHYLNPLN
jgi:hypothetical protein